MLFAGIDGGQSTTTAVVGDEQRVLGRGTSGPADEIGAPPDSTRLRDALAGALARAVANAKLPPQTQFASIVAGVSGYEGRVYGMPPNLPAGRFTMMHDAPIAHAGALGGAPGVVVIAGTGTVAYTVTRDGETKMTGGWGYLFGDGGSAFWIARSWVSAATGDAAYAAALLEYFGASTLRALVRSFYAGEISRERLASFAATVLDAGGPIVDTAAVAVAALASSAVVERPATFSFAGGLMRSAGFKEKVYDDLRRAEPGCAIVEPAAGPAEGALILARRT